MNKTVCLLLIIVFLLGCSSNSTTEKHQRKRDNIINVHDQIKEITIGRYTHWLFFHGPVYNRQLYIYHRL